MSTFIHDTTIVGCFLLALYMLAKLPGVFRTASLAEKARKAERMRRELDRSRMQPRYTPSDKARRIWHH